MSEENKPVNPKAKLSREEIIKLEIEEIRKHRWIESEKRGYDIGSYAAAVDWIEKYAVAFREYWDHCGDECITRADNVPPKKDPLCPAK